MSVFTQVALRRWDGKVKEARAWDYLEADPDLLVADGNCAIYLSQQYAEFQQPSFIIPFEKLVQAKCQPLFEKATAPEISMAHKRRRSTSKSRGRQRRQSCSLCLEAPRHYDLEGVIQYHVTTRNFFAWLLGKPIVGPDPASALLGLKIRMDVWRARTVDNFTELYQYAKAQNYGDLNDMQLFLTNHLRGVSSPPHGYKLLSATSPGPDVEPQRRQGRSLSRSIRRRVSSVHARVSRRRSNSTISDSIETIPTPAVSIVEAENAVMSGALSSSSPSDVSTTSLTPVSMLSISNSANTEFQQSLPIVDSTSSSNKPKLSYHTRRASKRHDGRTYSIPVLPRGKIEDVSRELEYQSSWIQNLTKEQYQLAASPSAFSQITPMDAMKDYLFNTVPLAPVIPGQSPVRMASHRRRASMSRAPSPIMEEEIIGSAEKAVPPVPPLNARRFSTSAVNLNRPYNSAEAGASSSLTALPMIDTEPTIRPAAAPVSSTLKRASISCISKPPSSSATMKHSTNLPLCTHALLPSHTASSCRSCGRRKPPEVSGIVRRIRPNIYPRGKRLSLDLEVARQKQSLNTPGAQRGVDLGNESPRREMALGHTRFPSLRRRNQSENILITPTKQKFPRPLSEQVQPKRPFYNHSTRHPNISEPDLTSDARYTVMYGPNRSVLSVSELDVQDLGEPDLTTSMTESPTEIATPISPIDTGAAYGLASKLTVATSDTRRKAKHDSSPSLPSVALLKASGGNGLLSTMLADPRAIDGHRVPLDELFLTSDATVMDSILQDITASISCDTSSRAATKGPQMEAAQAPSNEPTRFLLTTQMPEPAKNPVQLTRDSMKKRLRNSMRLWGPKRGIHSIPRCTESCGNILILDSSGNFSTLSLPVDSPIEYWQEEKFVDRAMTPLCELPVNGGR